MHYNFLFNGCSWTYGAELEGPEKNYEHQKNHRFSHLVSNHFGKTYDNISKSGISNDWIVEKTIDWFKKGNTCDLAIIQFTIRSRTIWYDDEKNKSYPMLPIPNPYTRKTSHNNHHTQVKAKLYYKTFYSDLLGYQNYYKNIFLLEQFFKLKNIKYFFLRLDNQSTTVKGCTWQNYCETKEIKKITEIIGTTYNFNKNNTVNENYCKDYMEPYLSGAHPSEIGHQKIANYLIEEINNAHFV